MKAVAVRKGLIQQKTPGLQEMGTFRCDGCGEEFLINHPLEFADKRVAEKQARWLEKVLAEEHERDRKHPDRIELPD
jgi:hypothetical protein